MPPNSNNNRKTPSVKAFWTDDEISRLARYIEQCPHLYQKFHRDYKHTTVCERGWNEIASKLMKPVDEVKAKFRNIRDSRRRKLNDYRKRNEGFPSSSNDSSNLVLHLYDDFRFLDPFFETQKANNASSSANSQSNSGLYKITAEQRNSTPIIVTNQNHQNSLSLTTPITREVLGSSAVNSDYGTTIVTATKPNHYQSTPPQEIYSTFKRAKFLNENEIKEEIDDSINKMGKKYISEDSESLKSLIVLGRMLDNIENDMVRSELIQSILKFGTERIKATIKNKQSHYKVTTS